MRFKFLQGTQVDHSRLRRSGRAFPSPRPPSPWSTCGKSRNRPVTLLPAISQICDRVALDQVNYYFDRHKALVKILRWLPTVFSKILSILGNLINLRFQTILYCTHLKQGNIITSRKVQESSAVDIWTNRNSVSVAMTFHLLHYYCLILKSNDNIFLFLRSIFLNFFLKIYGWKRNDILKFEGMFIRQVVRYSWITTTKNLSCRISWNFDMFAESSCLANVQSLKKFHRRKREKIQLKLLTWQNIDLTWSLLAHACKF
jgi:hypothetical protein